MSVDRALHPYQYVMQNPIAYWDPDGRKICALGYCTGIDVAKEQVKEVHDWVGDKAIAFDNDTQFAQRSEAFGNALLTIDAVVATCVATAGWGCAAAIGIGSDVAGAEVGEVITGEEQDTVLGQTLSVVGADPKVVKGYQEMSLSALSLAAFAKNQRNLLRGVLGGCKCFEAGTLVKTRNGLVAIEDVQVGDEVACSDVATGEWGWCEVLAPFSKVNEEGLVRVAVDGELLVSSESHPYWVIDGNELAYRPAPDELDGRELVAGHDGGRWVMARDLLVGDLLRLADGTAVAVTGLVVEATDEARIPVFNLTVEGMHNFAVGDGGVLVHNCSKVAKVKNGPKFGKLKDHARRHGGQHPNSYYNSAVAHTKTGTKFKFRHNGQQKHAFITRTGADSFTFTSASRSGKRIYTHMPGLTEAELLKTAKGVKLPAGF